MLVLLLCWTLGLLWWKGKNLLLHDLLLEGSYWITTGHDGTSGCWWRIYFIAAHSVEKMKAELLLHGWGDSLCEAGHVRLNYCSRYWEEELLVKLVTAGSFAAVHSAVAVIAVSRLEQEKWSCYEQKKRGSGRCLVVGRDWCWKRSSNAAHNAEEMKVELLCVVLVVVLTNSLLFMASLLEKRLMPREITRKL